MDKELFRIPEADEFNPTTRNEVLISAAALVAGFGMRKILEYAYEEVYDEKTPYNIDDRPINWYKVAGWTVVSGLAITSIKLLVRRGLAKKI